MKKQTIRQRIARAIDDNHGLRLSPSDVIDLDRLLMPMPKTYHTVSQDPFMIPYGKGLLQQAYEAQNAHTAVFDSGLENALGYSHYETENATMPDWELPSVVIYAEEKKTIMQSFKEKAKKYNDMIGTILRNYFHRGSN